MSKVIKITFICLAILAYPVTASVHNETFSNNVDGTGATTNAICSWIHKCPRQQ